MERKAYLQLAATKAKTLGNGQVIRITAEGKYYIFRDNNGKLYIGQYFGFNLTGQTPENYTDFFPNRKRVIQVKDSNPNVVLGYWQKYMPTTEEAIKHGVSEQTLAKWKAARKG